MRKNAFNAEERISAINEFRVAIGGKKFTKEQLLKMFKENRIPSNSTFWSVFRKSGIIKEVEKGWFTFTADNPIYYKDLEKVYRQYRSIIRNYAKPRKQAEDPQPEEKDEFIRIENPEALEAFAVSFLKELGYKILIPVATIYKEV